MPRAKRAEIEEQDITGLKYFRQLDSLLQTLHDVGCERDRAGNRSLHMDQYCTLILLYLFNPIVTSLRGLQQASELKKVQKKLKCPRASLGSLSESVAVFDSERLKPIIAALGEKLAPIAKDSRLQDIKHTLTLVDGTVITALPRIAMASFRDSQSGDTGTLKWTLHTHFEVDRHVPTRIDVTPTGGGEYDERAVMERAVESDRTYVMDRGYAKFELFNRIVDAGSSYVCRIRNNSVYDVVSQRELSEADRAARVLSDENIQLGSAQKKLKPNHPLRLIQIEMAPHQKRTRYGGKKTGPSCDGVLRLVTNLTDVPAEIIALLYRYRWTIEIFFRFFKHMLGCRHLLSHSQNGIEIQTYCAIIASMLISLWTGRKPTLRTYEMICWYFTGMCDEEELLSHISKLKKQID
ncbi:IS4 family transposase [Gimesia algae]|uniref:Transposase DDE domain protein n=1 Tax=Gimesia algae TaxID=2527971 RepID=A0A517VKU9_9PLAN|nr:IS4 family transposase [Gimesia algae]QDT93643.1 Transposase DDE domain protein [Gimesia algae]